VVASFDAWGYFFLEAGAGLERRHFGIDHCAAHEVLVQVAGCGLCHTDLGFMDGTVRTKQAPPLVLGHEISGVVVAAGDDFLDLVGSRVLVPAVLPCGECTLCRAGRDNICRRQLMPGNDFNGGFASHVVVPGNFLCPVPDVLDGFDLWQLAVISDAVTTPYQSLQRSGLRPGDLAIVIGVGGIGTYLVQHAKNAGAHVIAVDIDDGKLSVAHKQGAEYTLCARDMSERDLKQAIKSLVAEHNLPRYQWKIFEASGAVAAQRSAFALLGFGAILGIVGFTMDKLELRLSNLMAFDADVFGNWGCRPAHYPEVLKQVLDGQIELLANIEQHPLDEINDVVAEAQGHRLQRRAILVPEIPAT